jgi:DNA invertase Pin-like site-specific DNA recombinase
LQTDALEKAGCGRIFIEKTSGSHKERAELKAALDYMREGDTLVVWKLSRLARSIRQIIATAYDLEQRKIKLKVLTQNIDTGTSEGRLFFHVTAAFDEFQRELIVENTRAGLAAAHKRGRRGGRPPSMTVDKIRTAESMIKDSENYPFVTDIIKQLEIGRTTFYRHFPPERISELRQPK